MGSSQARIRGEEGGEGREQGWGGRGEWECVQVGKSWHGPWGIAGTGAGARAEAEGARKIAEAGAAWIVVGVERGNWSAEQTGKVGAAAAGVEVGAGLAGQIVRVGVGAGKWTARAARAKRAAAGVGLDTTVAAQIGRLGVVFGRFVA